jgi:hypothetical protein
MKWFGKLNSYQSCADWAGWGQFYKNVPAEDLWIGSVHCGVLRVVAPDGPDSALHQIGLTVHESLYSWCVSFRDVNESLAAAYGVVGEVRIRAGPDRRELLVDASYRWRA